MRKYECKTYLTTGREADRQLQYILLKGDEEGYKDILEICRAMGTKTTLEVNKMYIDHLVEIKRDARLALKVVQEVMAGSQRDGVELCRDIVDRAGISFKVEVGAEVEEANLQVLISMISTYNQVTGMGDLISKGEVLVNAKVLKRDYGIKTAETDWMNRSGSIRDMANNRVLLTRFIAEKVDSVVYLCNVFSNNNKKFHPVYPQG